MIRFLSVCCPALAAAFFVVALPSIGLTQPAEPTVAEIDLLMAAYDGGDRPGALLALVRGGEVVFERAYGMADLTHGVPMTVDTRANIASTAKQFTAFGLALLEREGRLTLDDDVRLHLPDLPDLGETVTLRHLLTHTSGYREFLNALAIGGWRIEDADHVSREEALRVVQRQPELQNAPGAQWNYNNTGYALAAMVVEAVTGERFEGWMERKVFAPLGMTRTLIRTDSRQIVPDAARGYAAAGDGAFREAPVVGAVPGPGSVYTTLGDLARWMGNLGTAGLGEAELMERLTTPYTLTSGEPTTYGLGVMVGRERGLRRIHHGGGELGHTSHFAYYPDLDAGVILLVNRGGLPAGLPARITDLLLGEHMEPVPGGREAATPAPEDGRAAAGGPVVFEAALFDDFAGQYELEVQPGFVLRFWREGERLMTRGTGQPAFEIEATSDSTFHLAAAGADVTFHRGAHGEVTGLTLHQNGNHAGRRLPDPEAHDLAGYAGRYYSEEFETYYDIATEGNGLQVTHRRRDAVTLHHEDGDTFAGSFPLIQVVFERSEEGEVTGFLASNVRARDIRFDRVR